MSFNLSSLRPLQKDKAFLLFAAALGVYGLCSSPTPDHPGWIELFIALALIISVGLPSLYRSFITPLLSKVPHWQLASWVFFAYGLIITTAIAAIHGYAIDLILRDIIGFIFLCLPLFVYPFLTASPARARNVFYVSLGIGFIFSLRVLFLDLGETPSSAELLYLANSPLVLMAALFFCTAAFVTLYRGMSIRHLGLAFLYAGITALIFVAMYLDLQRASFIAIAVTLMALAVIGFVKAPRRLVVSILFFALLAVLFQSYAFEIIENIAVKTSRVGFNMRLQELNAVWDVASASWQGLLFGQGWGSEIASPAVGGLNVTYTHSLLTYVLFKAGLVGLALCLIYLFFIFEKLIRLYFTDPVKGSSLMWPFLIPVFLYASHKSFDFGIILSLILVQSYRFSLSSPQRLNA